MQKLILEQRLSDLLSDAKEKEEEEDKPVNELEDKEVGAAASRDRDLDCVPTRLAHLPTKPLYSVSSLKYSIPSIHCSSTHYSLPCS